MDVIKQEKIYYIEPRYISPPEFSLRESFDDYDLTLLKNSIEIFGIINPLTVRRTDKARFALVSGERRLLAAKMLSMKRVPCRIVNISESEAAYLAFTTKLTTASLSFFEEAEALGRLAVNSGLDAEKCAERLGLSQSFTAHKLLLLKLNDTLKERIKKANLTEAHARALIKLPASQRESALDRIIAEDLSPKTSEELCKKVLLKKEQKPPFKKSGVADVKLFSNSINKLVTTATASGYIASSQSNESDEYIEYTVRLSKIPVESKYYQLPIC